MSIVPRPSQDGTRYQVRVKRRGRYLPAETFDTLKQAKLRERQLKGLGDICDSTESIDSFAARWLNDYPVVKQGPTRGRCRSSKTVTLYQGHLTKLCEELGAVHIGELSRPQAQAFGVRHPRSAMVARNMFATAYDLGLVRANPFLGLNLEQSKGRKDYEVLSVEQFHDLADLALDVHPDVGEMLRAQILFTCYVGPRLTEGLNLRWEEVNVEKQEVHFSVCKFDKARTVLLLPEAITALNSIPRRMHNPYVFYAKRKTQPARPLTATNHYSLWNPVRHAFLAKISQAERDALVDLDWHSLRHTAGHHFYVTLGFSDEEAAAQLGHGDAALIRGLYGHGRQGVLERMKQRLAA